MDSSDCSGRLYYPIQGSKAPSHISSYRSVVGPSCSPWVYSDSPGERSGRKGCQTSNPRLLQPSLLSSEERRLLETDYRPLDPEFFYRCSNIQDGNFSLYQKFHTTKSLGGLTGSVGRILSRPDPPSFSEVPSFLLQRRGLSVPGPAFRPINSPQGFHQTHGHCRGTPSPDRLGPAPILRRLVTPSTQPRPTGVRSQTQLGRNNLLGSSAQPNEVGLSTRSTFHFRGRRISNRSEHCQSTCSSGRGYSQVCASFPFQVKRHSSSLSFTVGHAECSSRPSSSRSPTHAPSSALSAFPLASQPGRPVRSDTRPCKSPLAPPLVAQRRSVPSRGPLDPTGSVLVSDHGRQPVGMGGPPGTVGFNGFRHMAPYGQIVAHQQSRDARSSACNTTVQQCHQEPLCASLYGQHNSGLICSQTGGDAFPLLVSGNHTPLQGVSVTKRDSSCQTSPWKAQCSGGQSVQETSSPTLRVDSPAGGSQHNLQDTRDSDGRLIRNKIQPSTPIVCLPGPGSSSLGSRRPDSGLELSNSVCLPSVHSASAGTTENQAFSVSDTTGSPPLASEVMVQRPPRSPQGAPKTATTKARPSVPKRSSASSKSRHSSSSRLAVIRKALRKKRFSERATSLIAQARRASTTKVYDSRWNIFSRWCRRRDVDPLNPSVRRIADFLVYLFDTKKLSVSTIRGYRSMISHTLSFQGSKSIGSDPSLSELVKALELRRPVARSLAPKWDLSCVLWSLTKTPFEPLDQADLKHLSWKTVFLLTLATAKRRSEIHALSVEEGHLRFNMSDGSVSLLCQTGFLAKNQLPSVAPSQIVVPSLSHSCGKDDEDRLLCPVRALKFYLSRVKPLRGHRKRLFLPLKGQGDISAASISRWIASTIRSAYQHLSDRDQSFLNIRPHELRALSTSWAFVNHTPLDDILKAAYWRNSTTFSSFYLRSFSAQQDNLFLLGPVVASQTIISGPSNVERSATI